MPSQTELELLTLKFYFLKFFKLVKKYEKT